MKFRISKQANKFLQRIPVKHAAQITAKIKLLLYQPDLAQFVELKGYKSYRRTKSGEYRIIYKIEREVLFVTLIGKRNDDEVYKRINRFLR